MISLTLYKTNKKGKAVVVPLNPNTNIGKLVTIGIKTLDLSQTGDEDCELQNISSVALASTNVINPNGVGNWEYNPLTDKISK